jgi:hypothetical protein
VSDPKARPYLKNNQHRDGGVAQAVSTCLTSALSSTASADQKKKKKDMQTFFFNFCFSAG